MGGAIEQYGSKNPDDTIALFPNGFEIDRTAAQIAAQACKILLQRRRMEELDPKKKFQELERLSEMKAALLGLKEKKQEELRVLGDLIRAKLNAPLAHDERIKLQRELEFLNKQVIQDARSKEPLSLPSST